MDSMGYGSGDYDYGMSEDYGNYDSGMSGGFGSGMSGGISGGFMSIAYNDSNSANDFIA